MLAALTAGGALGFLRHGFPPASSFMGDTGSNLLGYLLAAVAVQGALKTNAVVALFFPLIVLAVPILDTGFVVAKRIKYRQPIYQADRWHFHHRMANIGFSQRRTLAYLYGWALVLAGLALALRFVPYSDNHGHFNAVLDGGDRRLRGGGARGQRLPGRRARDPQAAHGRASASCVGLAAAPRRPEAEVDAGVARSSRPGASRPSTRRPASSSAGSARSTPYVAVARVADRRGRRPAVRIYSATPPSPGSAPADAAISSFGCRFGPQLSGRPDFDIPDDRERPPAGRTPPRRAPCHRRDAGLRGGRLRARLARRPRGPARPRRAVRGARRRGSRLVYARYRRI